MSEEELGHSEHSPELLCCLEGVTQSQFPCCKMSYYVLRVDAIICMSGDEHTSCQKELSTLRYCTDLGSGSTVNVGIMPAVSAMGEQQCACQDCNSVISGYLWTSQGLSFPFYETN